MAPLLSLILTLFFLLPISPSLSQPPRALLIDCGATSTTHINGSQWLPDAGFISAGVPKTLQQTLLVPTLSTLRSFPNSPGKKFCYVVPVYRTGKYLIRTTYYYGGVNGAALSPPVFDQIVDGTFWSVVNTTEDYRRENASYYEGVFVAGGKSMSVCIASNTYTESDPFISALELVLLADSVYNSTDFSQLGLSLVARHSFGYNGSIVRYPDDQFDRFWEPYGENSPTPSSGENASVSDLWNLPPSKIFQTQLAVSRPQPLQIQWPPEPLPNSTYYIALYFADDTSTPRMFDVTINDITYYRNLSVSQSGVAVFTSEWRLSGLTNISLSPAPGSTLGPLINAGEVFNVLPLGRVTLTRDVIALVSLKNSFQNPPPDWNGDPCQPEGYSWTGITCSRESRIRVIGLNLTSMGLSGSISPSIGNLTALSNIWLGNNSLSGSLPDLSRLKFLETIHLEDNHLTGEIPSSFGDINRLRELFLQNNNLTGQVPSSLKAKSGLNLRVSPGNPLLTPP